MSPTFLASLTLGALVAWLLCDLGCYGARLRQLARWERDIRRIMTPAEAYAHTVHIAAFCEARESMEPAEILALAA